MNESFPEIRGDAARQALDSLRGYAYQIVSTCLAWMSLRDDERLFVEVAEDYAVATQSVLTGTQVRDTAKSGSITFSSPKVAETVDSLFNLRELNPGVDVQLRYLTTSEIGKELRLVDQVEGESCLAYWRKAAASADVEPLREQLKKLSVSDAAAKFIEAASPLELRNELLKKIHWDCGQPPIEKLLSNLENALVIYGEKRGAFAQKSRRAADSLISHVLRIASVGGSRELNKAAFIAIFDDATANVFPDSELSKLVPMLSSDTASVTPPLALLQPVSETLIPDSLASRDELVVTIEDVLKTEQFVWLHAGAGYGKTTVALSLANLLDGDWSIARLRGTEATELPERIQRIRAETELLRPTGLIIDDIEYSQSDDVAVALAALVNTAKRLDILIIFTAYVRPSLRRLATVGLSSANAIQITELSEEQTAQLVSNLRGKADIWTRYVYLASVSGHPQLVHAMCLSLSDRGWPTSDLKQLSAYTGSDEELNNVRSEARRRLIETLSPPERKLLYRISIATGSISRQLAIHLTNVIPPIEDGGEVFDKLVGPWISETERQSYRLSPLVLNSGQNVLTEEDIDAVHFQICEFYTKGWSLPGDKFDEIFLHGIAGKNSRALAKASIAFLTVDHDKFELFAKSSTIVRLFRTDRPIYDAALQVSVQIRLIQCILLLCLREQESFDSAYCALVSEIGQLGAGERDAIRALAYGKLLMLPSFADYVPNFADMVLFLRDSEVLNSDEFGDDKLAPPFPASGDLRASLFPAQLVQMRSIVSLEAVFLDLSGREKSDVQWLMQSFHDPRFDRDLCIKGAWLHEVGEGTINPNDAIERYENIATICEELEEMEFAVAAIETASVILDESLKNRDAARQLLESAKLRFGEQPNFTRAIGRTYLHEKRYAEHLPCIESIVDTYRIDNDVEQTWLRRECGVSHGHLGNWKTAKRYFSEASARAKKVNSPGMTAASIGLLADAAVASFKCGEHADALDKMSAVLKDIEFVSPVDSLQSAGLHHMVRHTALWMWHEAEPKSFDDIDESFEMLPGINSDPSPHPDLKKRKIAALDMAWYLLEQAEEALGLASRIARLVDRLPSSKKIIGQEALRAWRKWQRAFQEFDGKSLRRLTESKLKAAHHIKTTARRSGLGDLEAPERGTLRAVPTEHEAQIRSDEKQSVSSFFWYCAVSDKLDGIDGYIELDSNAVKPIFTSSEVDLLKAGQVSFSPNPLMEGAGVIRRLSLKRENPTIEELIYLSIYSVSVVNGGELKPVIEGPICKWLIDKWSLAVENQGFRFKTPEIAKNAIRPVLKANKFNIGSVASIVIAAEPYVQTAISKQVLDVLHGVIANG